MSADDEELPYSQRPEWKDVEPVPQVDGPKPLAVIRYPPGFEEVHNYFRAIQQRDELSERALRLTADVIEHNSANYTAWYYRRRCLTQLGSDLQAELAFADGWSRDSPKNYQVWYHRRWLISAIAEQLRSKENHDEEIRMLGERELDYHLGVMQVHDAFKNYNGWSHRQFVVQNFGLWEKELDFVTDLIRLDVRNNSAWNSSSCRSSATAALRRLSATSVTRRRRQLIVLSREGMRALGASSAGPELGTALSSGGATAAG